MANPAIGTKIWLALRQRVETLPLTIPITGPGEVEPENAEHIRISQIVGRPVPSELSGSRHDRLRTLQILLHSPLRSGGVNYLRTQEVGGIIGEHFPAGLRLDYDGGHIVVTEDPEVSEGYREGGWWVTPVRIRTRTDV